MTTNGTTQKNTTENAQPKSPKSMICPRCGNNEKAVSKSGRVSGYCADCNSYASRVSKAKHNPSTKTQMKRLAYDAYKVADSLPKLTGTKKAQLISTLKELLVMLEK